MGSWYQASTVPLTHRQQLRAHPARPAAWQLVIHAESFIQQAYRPLPHVFRIWNLLAFCDPTFPASVKPVCRIYLCSDCPDNLQGSYIPINQIKVYNRVESDLHLPLRAFAWVGMPLQPFHSFAQVRNSMTRPRYCKRHLRGFPVPRVRLVA